MVSRFIAEARAVNQIRHRNIIDIFSFGKLADGRQYYVMEYLDGEPLDALIDRVGNAVARRGAADPARRSRRRSTPRTPRASRTAISSPRTCSSARDSDGGVFPKLLDFGIAKLLGAARTALKHKTRTGAPIGTPYYMSPEQCRGKRRRSPHRHLRVRRARRTGC